MTRCFKPLFQAVPKVFGVDGAPQPDMLGSNISKRLMSFQKSSTKCHKGDRCNVFAPSAFCKTPKMEKVTQKVKKKSEVHV